VTSPVRPGGTEPPGRADPLADVELRVAQAAARAGGEVLARRLREGADLEIDYKDARANLVTDADRESQRAVAGTILTAFPDHAVNGEEGTAGNFDSASVWYVDPLDGTTNFAHGVPFFCAARGRGATLNGRPLRVSDVTRLDRALVVAQAQTVDADEIRAYAVLVERLMSVCGGVRSLGSPALTLCAIAAGRLDAYCEYTMDAWDILAGGLILAEAGGTLTLFNGRPHETTEQADVIASNGHLHADLIAALDQEGLQ
jgi:myo-inositol-1(or 4)-monophosphatase